MNYDLNHTGNSCTPALINQSDNTVKSTTSAGPALRRGWLRVQRGTAHCAQPLQCGTDGLQGASHLHGQTGTGDKVGCFNKNTWANPLSSKFIYSESRIPGFKDKYPDPSKNFPELGSFSMDANFAQTTIASTRTLTDTDRLGSNYFTNPDRIMAYSNPVPVNQSQAKLTSIHQDGKSYNWPNPNYKLINLDRPVNNSHANPIAVHQDYTYNWTSPTATATRSYAEVVQDSSNCKIGEMESEPVYFRPCNVCGKLSFKHRLPLCFTCISIHRPTKVCMFCENLSGDHLLEICGHCLVVLRPPPPPVVPQQNVENETLDTVPKQPNNGTVPQVVNMTTERSGHSCKPAFRNSCKTCLGVFYNKLYYLKHLQNCKVPKMKDSVSISKFEQKFQKPPISISTNNVKASQEYVTTTNNRFSVLENEVLEEASNEIGTKLPYNFNNRNLKRSKMLHLKNICI